MWADAGSGRSGMIELAICGGTVVTAEETFRADIGITAGSIVAIEPQISNPGRRIACAT